MCPVEAAVVSRRVAIGAEASNWKAKNDTAESFFQNEMYRSSAHDWPSIRIRA